MAHKTLILVLFLSLYLIQEVKADYFGDPPKDPHAHTPPLTSIDRNHEDLWNARVIPDILDDFTPNCTLDVYFSDKHLLARSDLLFSERQVKDKPEVRVICPSLDDGPLSFTIAMTHVDDGDTPNTDRTANHEQAIWIARVPDNSTNHSGTKPTQWVEIDKGYEDILKYKGPKGPPHHPVHPLWGHRVVVAVLQGDNSNLIPPDYKTREWNPNQPDHWGLRGWAAHEKLKIVGAQFFRISHFPGHHPPASSLWGHVKRAALRFWEGDPWWKQGRHPNPYFNP